MPLVKKSVMTTRRDALTGLCAVTAAGLLPGGSAGAGDQRFSDEIADRAKALAQGQDVRLRMLVPHGSTGNTTPLIAAFSQKTGVAIEVFETPVDDINTELILDSLSSLNNYDIALPATFGMPDLVASDAIQPITHFSKKYEPAGFRDGILFSVGDSFDDETYGFQADGDAYVMFYHKGMLDDPDEKARYADKFGQALAAPLTWKELDQQLAFFNRPDDGQWGGLLFRTPSYLAWEWWVRFHAKGFWPFSHDMEPQIASAAGVAALEEMIDATRHLCPEVSSLGLFENWERYSRGDIYCNIGWGGSQKYFNAPGSRMRGNMVFGPTPGGMVNDVLLSTPYFNWGWDYVVPRNSKFPEIAYLFALFASTPDMSTLAVQQTDGFFDPYRPEHYDDTNIVAAYSPAFLKVHRASLENAIPDLYLRDQGEYFRVLAEWLTRALDGSVSPQTALTRVEQRWRLVTDRSGRTTQTERWQRLRSKYPAHLRASLRDIG